MARLSQQSANVAPMGKACARCSVFKPFTEFYRGARSPDGFHSYCKECNRKRRRSLYAKSQDLHYGPEEAERRRALRDRVLDSKPGFKICMSCEAEKPLERFNLLTHGRNGRHSHCKECIATEVKSRLARSPEDRLKNSLNTARCSARKKGLRFELTVEGLVAAWVRQAGRCFYTGIEMKYDGGGTPESVSVDRVDSAKGYTRDNVVLCCDHVNTMKSNLSLENLKHWCRLVLTNGKE